MNTTSTQEPIRILKYRPHLKWIYYAVLWTAVILFTANIIFSGFLFLNDSATIGMGTLLFGIFIAVLLWAEARYLLRPMAFAEVKVYSDRVVVDRVGKLFEILYSNIEKVNLAKVSYVGGWFTLVLKTPVEGKKKLKFTVVLERSDYVLDAIHKHSPALFAESSLESYRRTAVYSDHSWGRIYANAAAWPLILLKYLVIPGVAGYVAFLTGKKAPMILAPAGMLIFAYLVFIGEEFILGYRLRKRLKNNAQDLVRDVKDEQGVMTKGLYVYGAGVVVGFILIFV
jgi:hypothetical protein